MWRAQNAFMLLSVIVALWSAAVAQPGVTPEHRPTPPDSDEQRIADLVVASRILVQEGVVDSFGHVTVRSLNDPNHYFMPRAMPPALATTKDIVELNLDSVHDRRQCAPDERCATYSWRNISSWPRRSGHRE